MAIKVYGSCYGDSGNKYNIWFEIKENSHDVKNNSSNITLALKLKRNDGYASSAYNLTEAENNVRITVGGVEKVNTNISIDTRNSNVVLLGSWTGNVTHNVDGTLLLNFSGSFSMKGTSLSGGAVSGEFKCVDIPRVSTFSFDKNNVVIDESFNVTVVSASEKFTHELSYEIGSYKSTIKIPANEKSVSLAIPKEWANAIPYSKQGTIVFNLRTYSDGIIIGSVLRQLQFNIPETEEFLPTFGAIVKSNKNGKVPPLWDATIQDISTLTVKMSSAVGKYGSHIVSGSIEVDGIKKLGMEADFQLHNAGRINIYTTVTDSRGIKRTSTYIKYVDAYSKPTVEFKNLFRCDSSGNPLSNGNCAFIDFQKNYSSVGGLNFTKVYLQYRKNNYGDFSEPILITSTPYILNGEFLENTSYEIMLSITDEITSIPFEVKRVLSTGSIPFNIKKEGKGAAFGCYAENDNELTVGYDLNVKGKLKYNDISSKTIIAPEFHLWELKVNHYECLDLTYLKCTVTAEIEIPVNTWITLLTLTENLPDFAVPVNIITRAYEIDKNIKGYIFSDGRLEICADSPIYIGYGIFISVIF